MSKNTFISRRMFVLALGASSVCHAAKPLIDFDLSNGALIDFDRNGSLFGAQKSFNLAEDPYSLFDVEPDLTDSQAANKFKKISFPTNRAKIL